MKYIVILGDGMADYPVPELGNRTPLEAADKPNMDNLARRGLVGMARTIPEGMAPGSDAANMSVMGFQPAKYYSGRSPLEAVAMGIELGRSDVTYRTNLVTLADSTGALAGPEGQFSQCTMLDYSAGEISTEESKQLIESLQPLFAVHGLELCAGISYRHCAIRRNGETGALLTPPHDISGRCIEAYLPKGSYENELRRLMVEASAILQQHPVNQKRIAEGRHPANAVWFWGEGTKPSFASFESLYGKKGGVVCAVDLIRGLGRCAGMRVLTPKGATGSMVTDYRAKGEAALQLLHEGCDLVYIHIEAPDECGHQGNAAAKIRAIEGIDRDVLGQLMQALDREGEDYRILLCPDHPTPVSIRTHTAEPIPFVLYDSRRAEAGTPRYTEACAEQTGLFLEEGPLLMRRLLEQ